MEVKTILITQARSGSTRLPGKILKKINDESLLEIHLKRLNKCKNISKIIILLLIINTIYTPYRYHDYRYPLAISKEQEQYHKLLSWYENQDFENRTKIYLYPYFSIIAGIDPYNQKEHLDFWASSLQFSKKGDILIWDSHFGPNESGTPLADLESDKSWNKIHNIIPEKTFLTMNDQPFEIHVFEKVD